MSHSKSYIMDHIRTRKLAMICIYSYLINILAEGLCCAFILNFDLERISLNRGMFVIVINSWQ